MTAAQITALVVVWCLIGALAGAIANLSPDSEPAFVVRSIDCNAAQELLLSREVES